MNNKIYKSCRNPVDVTRDSTLKFRTFGETLCRGHTDITNIKFINLLGSRWRCYIFCLLHV